MLKLSLATIVKGLSVKDGDLNKDGIVDEKIFASLKRTLEKGPDASKSQTPVENQKRYTGRYFKEIRINA